jgi:RimJ/RimL family protein N-acetyltransferase
VQNEPKPQLCPAYPVRTQRLLLRPSKLDDVDELLDYRSSPDVCRYISFDPLSRQAIIDRLNGPR